MSACGIHIKLDTRNTIVSSEFLFPKRRNVTSQRIIKKIQNNPIDSENLFSVESKRISEVSARRIVHW
jgi:hypothetical protein